MLRPNLRFPGFDEEWDKDRFGELCSFEQGVQVDVELQLKENQSGWVRFVRIENYTQNSQDFRYIPKELAKKKTIHEKEIAIVRYGATAGFIGRGFDGVLANNLFKLKPNEKLLVDEYLYHYLKSYKAFHYFQSEMAGGAMPALSFGIVGALKLPYTTLPEQQKIATFLTTIDKKITHLTQKKEALTQYKKGMMQKLFPKTGETVPELRFPGFDGKWFERRLSEVSKIIDGDRGTNYPNGNDFFDAGYCLFMNAKNVTKKGFSFKECMFITKVKDEALRKGRLKREDLVLTTRGSIGHIAYFDQKVPYENIRINSGMVIIRCGQSSNSPDFIYKFLDSDFFKKQVKRISFGSAQPQLTVKEINLFKIPLTVFSEQKKITNFLTTIDKKITQLTQKKEALTQYKKGLLQQMFV
jgi:type I restriction enzyme, S subunit